MELAISNIAHHRNGISGTPFVIILFEDSGPETDDAGEAQP